MHVFHIICYEIHCSVSKFAKLLGIHIAECVQLLVTIQLAKVHEETKWFSSQFQVCERRIYNYFPSLFDCTSCYSKHSIYKVTTSSDDYCNLLTKMKARAKHQFFLKFQYTIDVQDFKHFCLYFLFKLLFKSVIIEN